MSYSQPEELEAYFKHKAEQEQKKEEEAEDLSAYEACVLKESARVKQLIAESQSPSETAKPQAQDK